MNLQRRLKEGRVALVLQVSDSRLSFLAFELVENLRKKMTSNYTNIAAFEKKLYQYDTVETSQHYVADHPQ